jgi:hypothetical protein
MPKEKYRYEEDEDEMLDFGQYRPLRYKTEGKKDKRREFDGYWDED